MIDATETIRLMEEHLERHKGKVNAPVSLIGIRTLLDALAVAPKWAEVQIYRRTIAKLASKGNYMEKARRDGRPLYYDIPKSETVQCYYCILNGVHSTYACRDAVMNDPANSPDKDGGVYTVCINHVPDDAVIHDPFINQTRTKDGQTTWTEKDA